MKGVEQPEQFHPEGDVWIHTLMLLERMRNPSVTLALGALLHDVGKPPTFRRADRIRFDGHAALGAKMAVRDPDPPAVLQPGDPDASRPWSRTICGSRT